jgi:hypothetical protein
MHQEKHHRHIMKMYQKYKIQSGAERQSTEISQENQDI